MNLVGKGDKHIIIENDSQEEAGRVLENIHKQLVGNQDYIDSNIVLNDDGCTVHLYIFKETTNVPKIQI